jgi:hypothetical protein
MNLSSLESYPDLSQIWVYGFSEPLTQTAHEQIDGALQAFCSEWNSHGVPVTSEFVFVDDRFVILVADSSQEISGCSIDSSVRVFKEIHDTHGLDGLNRSLIFFRDPEGRIQAVPYLDFQGLVDTGGVGMETPVFDTTLIRLGQLREGLFELPFRLSWHARSFPVPARA